MDGTGRPLVAADAERPVAHTTTAKHMPTERRIEETARDGSTFEIQMRIEVKARGRSWADVRRIFIGVG
jgi:hypothetical protein